MGFKFEEKKSFSLLNLMGATGYLTQMNTIGWVVHMLRDSSRALASLSISTNTQDLIPDSLYSIQFS